ncbi:hypothetical protein Tco_0321281 [Tanacetum coccineum]
MSGGEWNEGGIQRRRATFEPGLTAGAKGGSRHTGGQIQVKNGTVLQQERKLGPKWEGPYRVTEAFENGSYKLQTMEDKMLVNVIARTPSFNEESNFPMNACYNHWRNKSHRQPSHRVK